MRYYLSFIFLLIPFIVSGQLTAPGSNAVRYTSYLPHDQIFFYCNRTGEEKGQLTAERPGGAGLYNFVWSQWSNSTNSFDLVIKTEIGVSFSTVSGLLTGGYKVDIDKSGIYDTSMVCWIFFDQPPVAEASLAQVLCTRVALKGKADAGISSFSYKDPANGVVFSVNNEISHLWSSNPSSYIPAPTYNLNPIIENYPVTPPYINFNLPLEDLTYKIEVNSLGCKSESSFFYEPIHVRADFDALPMEGEAPLEVIFTDKSVRAYTYKWEFGDDTESDLSEPPPHTYNKPGKYSVKLTIESELHCIDSLRSDSIVVQPSSMAIPNVFTPDGDSWNDFFKVESTSMRYISMEVYSRSGLKVYGFSGEGEVLREWKGWDGKINNSSIEARPGVYFYIIRALGWDNVRYDKKEYRGTVYLYR